MRWGSAVAKAVARHVRALMFQALGKMHKQGVDKTMVAVSMRWIRIISLGRRLLVRHRSKSDGGSLPMMVLNMRLAGGFGYSRYKVGLSSFSKMPRI